MAAIDVQLTARPTVDITHPLVVLGTCADATLNVNGVQFDTIASGDTYPLLVKLDGVETGTFDVPNKTVNITSVPCADATVQLNGVDMTDIPSGDTENIEIRQSTGATQVGSKQGVHWRIDDSNIQNTDGSYTVNVKAEDSLVLPDITFTDSDGSTSSVPSVQNITCTPSPDATVENSDASYTTTVASGATLVLPNITVTDSDGTTSSVPSVQDVTCTPQVKSLFIKFGFQIGNDTTGTLTIDADNAGTFTSTSNDGSSGTITYNVNGGGFAAFVNPTVLGIGDTIAAQRTITTGEGYAKITGTYV
jgi:hypothetical protein